MQKGPGGRALAGTGAALAVAVLVAGCGSAAAPTPTPAPTPNTQALAHSGAEATLGHLWISGAYVPQPASPDVAAAYLTIENTGATADALTSVGTDTGGTASLHRTVGGAMVSLNRLDIPAHGTAALTPGGSHLMIENPSTRLTLGGTIVLTLTFEHAGTVALTTPITTYDTSAGTTPPGTMSPGTMSPGMNMSGMNMPGMSSPLASAG